MEDRNEVVEYGFRDFLLVVIVHRVLDLLEDHEVVKVGQVFEEIPGDLALEITVLVHEKLEHVSHRDRAFLRVLGIELVEDLVGLPAAESLVAVVFGLGKDVFPDLGLEVGFVFLGQPVGDDSGVEVHLQDEEIRVAVFLVGGIVVDPVGNSPRLAFDARGDDGLREVLQHVGHEPKLYLVAEGIDVDLDLGIEIEDVWNHDFMNAVFQGKIDRCIALLVDLADVLEVSGVHQHDEE